MDSSARPVRAIAAVILAGAIGGWLTLAQLVHPDADGVASASPVADVWFFAAAGIGLVLLVVLVRWHAVWMSAAGTIAFGYAYETWFWTRPPGVGDGMDYISYHPGSSWLYMFFVIPFTAGLAAVWSAIRHRDRLRALIA